MEKNLSRFFKIPSGLAEIALGKQVVKLVKKWFYFGEGGFGGGKVVFGPPLGW
jgi:hypothetical protein